MTLEEFVSKYNMHDSLIDSISIEDDTIVIVIDFAFWMQEGFNDGQPETGPLEVRFIGVKNYKIPNDIPLDEISILKTSIKDNAVLFAILNDMTDEYLEIAIESSDIIVL